MYQHQRWTFPDDFNIQFGQKASLSFREEYGVPAALPKKILIFTSHTGGGHISLANALRDRLEGRYQVELSDPQPHLVHLHYRLVSRHALWLWAAEFRMSDGPRRARLSHATVSLAFRRQVLRVLNHTQPDLVISTYPYLTCEVTDAMRQSGRRVPFVMLFADPNGVHQSWLTEKNASAVLAPTRETYQQALDCGFTREWVHLSGWPVRAQFYRDWRPLREETLLKLGLRTDLFTVFLQGGGEGAAGFMQTLNRVLSTPGLQVILAAGSNKVLFNRCQNIPRLAALPFTREIAPFMAAADVIMGKAGPNMLFETVTLGKPFISTAYIPGQEEPNLEFIRRYRLGWVALDGESQADLLRRLVTTPSLLEAARSGVMAYRKWNNAALESIVPCIDNLLN